MEQHKKAGKKGGKIRVDVLGEPNMGHPVFSGSNAALELSHQVADHGECCAADKNKTVGVKGSKNFSRHVHPCCINGLATSKVIALAAKMKHKPA